MEEERESPLKYPEIAEKILGFLGEREDRNTFARVCKTWRAAAERNSSVRNKGSYLTPREIFNVEKVNILQCQLFMVCTAVLVLLEFPTSSNQLHLYLLDEDRNYRKILAYGVTGFTVISETERKGFINAYTGNRQWMKFAAFDHSDYLRISVNRAKNISSSHIYGRGSTFIRRGNRYSELITYTRDLRNKIIRSQIDPKDRGEWYSGDWMTNPDVPSSLLARMVEYPIIIKGKHGNNWIVVLTRDEITIKHEDAGQEAVLNWAFNSRDYTYQGHDMHPNGKNFLVFRRNDGKELFVAVLNTERRHVSARYKKIKKEGFCWIGLGNSTVSSANIVTGTVGRPYLRITDEIAECSRYIFYPHENLPLNPKLSLFFFQEGLIVIEGKTRTERKTVLLDCHKKTFRTLKLGTNEKLAHASQSGFITREKKETDEHRKCFPGFKIRYYGE